MVEEHQARKLAVILHADIVGSTELVRNNETIAHDRIQRAFQHCSEILRTYGGLVREIRGDALVAEFSRPSDAVLAAVAAQSYNTERNSELDGDIRPAFRVGIALGEVVIADSTITGPGVVLAQRLEQLAPAGAVCISAAVHEATPSRFPFNYASLGSQKLKGFDEPVHAHTVTLEAGTSVPPPEPPADYPVSQPKPSSTGWLVTLGVLLASAGVVAWLTLWQPDEAPDSTNISFPSADVPSIAVLPFDNLSGDQDQEYFSDGLTEDLITEISRISGLRVIARHSSFAYKQSEADIQQIGRELGARYVVDGSVRRSSDRLRISAQLIDAEDGTHMWAERYDRKLIDVFELQDEVTQTIVSSLAVKLTDEEERFLERVKTVNPDAYDTLLRGLEPLHRFTRTDSELAREYFMQAISLDPAYARAHANLALTYGQDVSFGWTDDQGESIRLALESIERAEALDETIVQTHFARSTIHLVQRQYRDAEASIRRAIQLDPNYADGYGQSAITLLYAGKLKESLAAISRAKRLNPRYPFVYLWIEGHAYFLMGEHEKSIEIMKEVLERNPAFAIARLTLISNYGHLGMEDEASWEVDELLTLRPDYSLSTAREEALHSRPQDLEKFVEGLRRAGISG